MTGENQGTVADAVTAANGKSAETTRTGCAWLRRPAPGADGRDGGAPTSIDARLRETVSKMCPHD